MKAYSQKCPNEITRIFSVLIIFLITFKPAISIEEMEIKNSPPGNSNEKVTLKGNIREDISTVKPQTGIGVIGLRFIHQAGFPSYVEQVYPNSPASMAGIRPKDLIYSIDGVRTNNLNSDSVFELLSGTPGTTVRLNITRGQSMFNVLLTREDLANFSSDIQNRYLSGPISVPFNPKDLFPYH
jgi:predicted metalloprotease with PDZ domain